VWTAGNVLATSSISNGIGVTNNDFYVTNVGLYVDPDGTGLAPPYEAPNYSDELARCQRYYHKNVSEGNGWVFSAIGFDATARSFYGMLYYPVEMRASPSITLSGLNYGNASGAVVNGTPAVKSFRMNAASVGAGSCYAAGYYTANARM
jgi:hypothetical protein